MVWNVMWFMCVFDIDSVRVVRWYICRSIAMLVASWRRWLYSVALFWWCFGCQFKSSVTYFQTFYHFMLCSLGQNSETYALCVPPPLGHIWDVMVWRWKLSLCYSIVYYYKGAQWYEQFLQVGPLYRDLILLGLALCLPSTSVSSVFIYSKKFLVTSLSFTELSLVVLALDVVD